MAKDNTQEQFAALVGISQQRVSQLIRKGVLTRRAPVSQWLREYINSKSSRPAFAGF